MTKDKFFVSCIIPAYNEAGRVGNVVRVAKSSQLIGEVIVVSDGSIDNTAKEARESGADKVIVLPKNMGKGGAVSKGAEVAKYPYLLILDADLIGLDEKHIAALIQPLAEGQADMTIGIFSSDPLQPILPHIAGQRALRRDLILKHPELRKSAFRLELLLNYYAQKSRQKIQVVYLDNLSHYSKQEKYGAMKAAWKQFQMTTAITSRFFKRLVQIILVIASLWIYLTVFSPYLGRSQMSLPSLIEPTSNDRILVIVAHPDDEILGAAGYIKKTIEKGGEAHIVIVTNGDANKFYYISAERLFYKNKQFFIEEGNERINETINAIAKLGLNDDHIDFLGFPDRGLNNLLTSNWNHSQPYFSPYTKTTQSPYINTFDPSSNYSGEDLVKNLKQIIKEVQPTKIFTHTIFDIHPDHRATAEFVNLALKELKTSDDFKDPNLYSFLVHYRDYPRPLGYEPDHYLSPPKDLLENSKISWFVFPLDSELQEAKHQATLQFKSQLKSPFLNLLLKSFIRKNELFIEIK